MAQARQRRKHGGDPQRDDGESAMMV